MQVQIPQADATILLTMIAQFISQLKANGIAAGLIQGMKSSNWKAFSWINADTPTASRLLGVVAASFTAAGMSATFHNGILTVSGITAGAVAHLLWNVGQNYLMQHAWYKTIFKDMMPAQPAPVQVTQATAKP